MGTTIRVKLALLGAGSILVALCIGAAGYFGITNASAGLKETALAGTAIRNHLEADMMHDALRSDVFGALLSSDPANGVDPAEMKAGLKEHRETFEAAVAETKPSAPAVSPRVQRLSPAPDLNSSAARDRASRLDGTG